jgi:transmembrane sensor
MEKESRIIELILRKKHNVLTEDERIELEIFCNESEKNKQFVARYDDEIYLAQRFEEKKAIDTSMAWVKFKELSKQQGNRNKPFARMRWIRVAVAASFVLVICPSIFLWINYRANSVMQNGNEVVAKVDLTPGKDKAILTLADGSTVMLDSVEDRLITSQGGTQLLLKEGQLEYKPDPSTALSVEGEENFNVVSTPRGAQFKVILPDGSRVWLNAASSIRYPVKFDLSARKVEITGEAYFEVAKKLDKTGQKRIPFLVAAKGSQVEVLGTHFNINAYQDEEAMKTTLLEGSVRVTPVPVSGGGPVPWSTISAFLQ